MEPNEIAPDFELLDLEGRPHRLGDYRDRIVIINFWSCECPHSERTDRALIDLCAKWNSEVVLLPVASNRIESAQALADGALTRRLPVVLVDRELRARGVDARWLVVGKKGVSTLRFRGVELDQTWQGKSDHPVYADAQVVARLVSNGLHQLEMFDGISSRRRVDQRQHAHQFLAHQGTDRGLGEAAVGRQTRPRQPALLLNQAQQHAAVDAFEQLLVAGGLHRAGRLSARRAFRLGFAGRRLARDDHAQHLILGHILGAVGADAFAVLHHRQSVA